MLDAAAFDLVYCCSRCDMVPCCVHCFEAGGRHHQHSNMKLDPDGVKVVRQDLLEAVERSMDDCIRKCFAVVNELEYLGHQTQSAMQEMRRRIRTSCANLRTVMAQKYDNMGDDLKSLENWSTRDTEELARNNEIFRNYLALKLEQLDAVLALGDRNPTAGVNVWVHLFNHPGCGLMPLLSGQFQPLMDSPEPMTVPWNKLTCEEVRRLLHPCDSVGTSSTQKTLSSLDGLRTINQQLGRQIHHIDVIGNLWKDSEVIEFPPSPAEYHQQKVNLIHSVLGDSELREILLPLYDSYAADFHAEAEALVSGWVVPKGLRAHQQQQQLHKSGSGPSEATAFDFAYKGPMPYTPEFLDVSVQLEGFLFRRDAFHQQWGLVRLALACDQFLLVSNVVRADTHRPLTLQTDPETQTLICLELPRLIENDQLVYLPPDSVVCLWGEEVEGIRCEVRHFVEPGISPLARMHQGAVKAGFECVRKQGDVALSYWLFGTDSAPAVHRWLTAVRDVIKGRQQHKGEIIGGATSRRIRGYGSY
ncbi:MAG: LOW QUALITY PROTEIN: hypothetical protein KVP17_001238 [Porospora cf. gigantea B]|uniref:uncharacterized protein n=1 Tax=Porospora cf. gigantea B TaxID=2853592 RepID=UPI003571C2BF|nr:MAG: LOW QUALITY PROTEIN: hypothetical protein KVP17_001238 [Porospora cf. gigantea B]